MVRAHLLPLFHVDSALEGDSQSAVLVALPQKGHLKWSRPSDFPHWPRSWIERDLLYLPQSCRRKRPCPPTLRRAPPSAFRRPLRFARASPRLRRRPRRRSGSSRSAQPYPAPETSETIPIFSVTLRSPDRSQTQQLNPMHGGMFRRSCCILLCASVVKKFENCP